MTYHFHNLYAKKTVMFHCPAAKQKPGETSSASKVHVRNYSAPGSGQDLVEYAASFRIFLHLAAVHLLAFVTKFHPPIVRYQKIHGTLCAVIRSKWAILTWVKQYVSQTLIFLHQWQNFWMTFNRNAPNSSYSIRQEKGESLIEVKGETMLYCFRLHWETTSADLESFLDSVLVFYVCCCTWHLLVDRLPPGLLTGWRLLSSHTPPSLSP